MQTSAERFNTISENFTKSEVHRLGASMIRFSELIGGARDLTIGDVACGPGHFGFSLARHAARIVGIDPSPNMLIVLGSGYRGTIEQLTPTEVTAVKEANLAFVRDHEITRLETNALYAIATKKSN